MTFTRRAVRGVCCGLVAVLGLVADARDVSAVPVFDVSQDLITVTPITAQDFSFTQGGFVAGGLITGTFSGVDTDGNNQLSAFNSEITDFSLAFSGNALVPAFAVDFLGLFGLVYDLDGGPLGDGLGLDIEGIVAGVDFFSYVAGPGPFDVCGIGVDCAFVAGAVPEPAILWLGIMGLAGWMRHRAHHNGACA